MESIWRLENPRIEWRLLQKNLSPWKGRGKKDLANVKKMYWLEIVNPIV